jgi:predicted nucleic acid-binding Zn ribbon protein
LSRFGAEPKRMGDLLRSVGRDLGLGAAVGTGRVWARWTEIVGDAIADHAEPTSLKDGVLRIRTDSPAWATELGYRGAEITRRANAVAGAPIVTQVRVWTGPGPIERRSGERRAAGSGGTGGAGSESPGDPETAFRRARAAWARRWGGGRSRAAADPAPETPRKLR